MKDTYVGLVCGPAPRRYDAVEVTACDGCGGEFAVLPVVDDEDWLQRRYHSQECLEDSAERYWTAVWST